MCCGNDEKQPAARQAVAIQKVGPGMTVRYIGDGLEYYPGLQNADLTDEQWEALPEDVRDMLVRRKMFEIGSKDKKAASTKKAGEEGVDNGA